MSAKQENLSKLPTDKKKELLTERLKSIFDFADQETATFREKLFSHYERLNIFPQTQGTLDASVKALVNMWRSKNGNSPSVQP